MLDVRDISRAYGSIRALDGFELSVAAGEVTGLLGHNGAGKTTLVEVVAGLVRPDSGTVHIAGVDALRHPRIARSLVGVAPQEQALYLAASVRENLRLFAVLRGLRPCRARQEIDEVVADLLLEDVVDRPVGLLSGGQRRRVQTASALFGHPPLLLLDEPTVGADPQTRTTALLAAVRRRANEGTAIVYTTHYLPELVELGATLAVARSGRVVARGSQHELLAGLPAHLEVEFSGPVPHALVHLGEVAEHTLIVRTTEPTRVLADVAAAGHELRSVDVHHATLDDLFAALGDGVRNAA
jgi:ABC-2 type transport system ATP-binding protein